MSDGWNDSGSPYDDAAYNPSVLESPRMIKGTPVELPCPKPDRWGRCQCGACRVCGFQKHVSVHGGVMDKPGFIYGHEFSPRWKAFELCQECNTQIKCAAKRECDIPTAYGSPSGDNEGKS